MSNLQSKEQILRAITKLLKLKKNAEIYARFATGMNKTEALKRLYGIQKELEELTFLAKIAK